MVSPASVRIKDQPSIVHHSGCCLSSEIIRNCLLSFIPVSLVVFHGCARASNVSLEFSAISLLISELSYHPSHLSMAIRGPPAFLQGPLFSSFSRSLSTHLGSSQQWRALGQTSVLTLGITLMVSKASSAFAEEKARLEKVVMDELVDLHRRPSNSNCVCSLLASLSLASPVDDLVEPKTGVVFPGASPEGKQLTGIGLRKKNILGLKSITVYAYGSLISSDMVHTNSKQCSLVTWARIDLLSQKNKLRSLCDQDICETDEIVHAAFGHNGEEMQLAHSGDCNVGLYADPDSLKSSLLTKYESFTTAELSTKEELFADITESDVGLTVRLVIVYGKLKIGSIRSAFEESVGRGLKKFSGDDNKELLGRFTSIFSDDLKLPKGTTIDITRLPGQVLQTKIDGQEIGSVESSLLCQALFDLYIGDDAFDKSAKETMGLGFASIMSSS